MAEALNETVLQYSDRRFATREDRELEIVVDPVLGGFSAWYEFFPRSTSRNPAGMVPSPMRARSTRLRKLVSTSYISRPFTRSGIQFSQGQEQRAKRRSRET